MSGSAWSDRADDMLAALAAVGITATMDPRKVNAPCALITPPDLERVVGCPDPFAAWTVHLIAPAPSDLDAIKWLLDHLTDAFNAVNGFTAEFGNLTISDDAGPMPAYTITVVTSPL